MTQLTSTSGYADEADAIFRRYERRSSAEMLAKVLDWFPAEPSDFLDIGAGTGRDAAYYAGLGHRVVAVEPVTELREGAIQRHPDPNIRWLDDGLPDLDAVRGLNQTFDMITLHAVWMHLDAAERATGMGHIAHLLRPGARLFLTQRHGPIPKGRRMFDISAAETIALAEKFGLQSLFAKRGGSEQPENIARGVEWTRLIFEKHAS